MGLLWPVTPASLGTKGVCGILISDGRGSECSFLGCEPVGILLEQIALPSCDVT